MALISSGTLTLAGGNNLVLSQDGNAVTFLVSEIFVGGISDLGNFSGTTGTADERIIFVGGNNVTLSQSVDTDNNQATITISGAVQTQQTQNIIRDVNIIGNTSGTTADITSGTLSLAGGNNITLSQIGNIVTIQGTQTVQTQNVIDISLSGNTDGTLALISSGTLTLAGGNNIVLSQNGNAVTISVSEIFVEGVSNLGNTSGTTGLVDEQVVYVGGNNITLIQSRNAGADSATITISAASQSQQTQNIIRDVHIIGNTSGTTADISSGTLHLAGGNNITLSQNANSITIEAQSQSVQTQNLIDVTIAGNTAGTLALISSGTLTLAGGNNLTLSQDGNVITISGGNSYSAGMSNLGNTSGTTGLVSQRLAFVGSGNITLIQSVNAGSATLSISGSQSQQTQNIIRQINAGGNTSGTVAGITSGTLTIAGGNNITVSQAGNVLTISAFDQTTPILSYWQNGDQTLNTLATSNGTFWIAPLTPAEIFPGNMTVNTALLNISCTDEDMTQAHSMTWRLGIYTINGVSLSLLNSVSATWGAAQGSDHTSLFSGERFVTIHSSAWSNQPVFSEAKYYIGLIGHSAGNNPNYRMFGYRILESANVRSGTLGIGLTSGNTSMGVVPWIGLSNASRASNAALPTNIQLSQLSKIGALYGFVPHVQFNNISSNF